MREMAPLFYITFRRVCHSMREPVCYIREHYSMWMDKNQHQLIEKWKKNPKFVAISRFRMPWSDIFLRSAYISAVKYAVNNRFTNQVK